MLTNEEKVMKNR